MSQQTVLDLDTKTIKLGGIEHHCLEVKRGDPSSLLSTTKDVSAVLGFPEHNTLCPAHSWRLLKDWSTFWMRRGWELGLFGQEKRRLRRMLSLCISDWWEGMKMKPGSSQQHPLSGQEAKHTSKLWNSIWTQENTFLLIKHWKKFTEWLCSLHPWRFSKPSRTQSWAACPSWSCFSRALDSRWSQEVPANLTHSVCKIWWWKPQWHDRVTRLQCKLSMSDCDNYVLMGSICVHTAKTR